MAKRQAGNELEVRPDYPWQDREPVTPFPNLKIAYCPKCGSRMIAERWWDKHGGGFLNVYRSACEPGTEWIRVYDKPSGQWILRPFNLEETR